MVSLLNKIKAEYQSIPIIFVNQGNPHLKHIFSKGNKNAILQSRISKGMGEHSFLPDLSTRTIDRTRDSLSFPDCHKNGNVNLATSLEGAYCTAYIPRWTAHYDDADHPCNLTVTFWWDIISLPIPFFLPFTSALRT